MEVRAGLLIDFGNSDTRVILIGGLKAFQFNLSNGFAKLPKSYNINDKYNNDKSNIFYYNDSYYANGQLALREFKDELLVPTALQSKTTQLTTDLTLNLAVIKSLTILSSAYGVPLDQLQVSFNVSVLLPPNDHEVFSTEMEDKIKNLSEVFSFMPFNFSAEFAINKVDVYSEAVAAFFGAFFKEVNIQELEENEGKTLEGGDIIVIDNGPDVAIESVEPNQPFQTGYVLVIDIGAGTTDVALFKDIQLIERSKDTFKLGGKTVESNVINAIKKKYGYTPEIKPRLINEAILEEGTEDIDIADIVIEAKESYSKSMKQELMRYLERMSIEMPVVKGILIAGGGALPSIRDGVIVAPAMSEVLMKYLLELAPRLKTLDLSGKNLRYLNIEGLKYLHKYAEQD